MCITKRIRNSANVKMNELNYMSTDLRHDLNRESEDRHSQNWREYLEQERARVKAEAG